MYRLDVLSHGGGLPLFSAKPAVTFPAEECRRSSTSTKLYCFVTEAHRCQQLVQGCYAALSWWKLNLQPTITIPIYQHATSSYNGAYISLSHDRKHFTISDVALQSPPSARVDSSLTCYAVLF